MNDELISFETAKLAKEKGFDIPTYVGQYDKEPNNRISKELINWNEQKTWLDNTLLLKMSHFIQYLHSRYYNVGYVRNTKYL